MSVIAALLNAQRRSDNEARRITEAMAAAMSAAGDGDTASACAAAALSAAAETNQQIADEKMPRCPAAPGRHRDSFAEIEQVDFDDEQRDESMRAPLRADSRFLLGDDQPTGGIDESVAAPGEPTGAGTAAGSPPWRTNDDDPNVSDDSGACDANTGVKFIDDGDGDITEADDDDAPSIEPLTEPDGSDDHAGSSGETSEQPQRDFAVIPSTTDAYARLTAPWDQREELDIPAGAVLDPGDYVGLAPAAQATDPPDEIDTPEPEAKISAKQRLRERIAFVQKWVRNDHSRMVRTALIVGAAVLTIGGLGVSLHGTRGKPPVAANTIAPAPPGADNAEHGDIDGPLTPSTVSASCGNDSDAVAPFTGQKPGHMTRAWVCTRINGLDLNVLNITFDKPVVITSIALVPGWDYVAPDGRDEWTRHRLITAVTWRMGGAVYPQNIAPTRTGVTKQFPSVITQEMSMTITASTRPPVGEDKKYSRGIGGSSSDDDPSKVDETTAVSSIVINGNPIDSGS